MVVDVILCYTSLFCFFLRSVHLSLHAAAIIAPPAPCSGVAYGREGPEHWLHPSLKRDPMLFLQVEQSSSLVCRRCIFHYCSRFWLESWKCSPVKEEDIEMSFCWAYDWFSWNPDGVSGLAVDMEVPILCSSHVLLGNHLVPFLARYVNLAHTVDRGKWRNSLEQPDIRNALNWCLH